MTQSEFRAWRKRLHLSQPQAAEMLGISPRSVWSYEKREAEIPRAVALACAAIEHGLPPCGS